MKKMKEKMREDDGFTLIEMLIVILIISVLLILVVSNLGGVNTKIEKTRNDGIVQTVESQQLIYEMDTGSKISAEELQAKKIISAGQLKAYQQATKNKRTGE